MSEPAPKPTSPPPPDVLDIPPPTPLRERIARLLRTERLRVTEASPIAILYSPDAPAEDADLKTADLVLEQVRCGRP